MFFSRKNRIGASTNKQKNCYFAYWSRHLHIQFKFAFSPLVIDRRSTCGKKGTRYWTVCWFSWWESIPSHLNNVVLYTILLENILTHSMKHIWWCCLCCTGASYFVGRFLSSLFWGVVADRIGRKPIIVFSVLSVWAKSSCSRNYPNALQFTNENFHKPRNNAILGLYLTLYLD